MTLFIQFLIILIGLILVIILGRKGFFINIAIVLIIILNNNLLSYGQILVLLLSAAGLYYLAEYTNKISKKKYDYFPVREMLLSGSAVSMLAGMFLRPIFLSVVLGPILGVPLLRRAKKWGYKAIFLAFGSFILRVFYSLVLNIIVIVKLF